MVYFNTHYLHVEYHEKDNVLISQWYGACSSLQYRQALIMSLRLAREFSISFAVTDRRLLPPLSESDLTWTTEIYHKAFNALPLKRFALIKPFNKEAELQQLYLINSKVNTAKIEARAFDDLTSAYYWLTTAQA
jgi:hypothetical protein